MLTDVWTVMRKELQEAFNFGDRVGKFGILFMILSFGILLPWQMGKSWVESPITLIYWSWVPLFLVNAVVADSFAGERERHTLETLLASRLADQAILFGKLLAALAYGVGLTWVSLLVGLITINLVHGEGRLLFYPPAVALGVIGISLLSGGLAAGAGILVSLRAKTVQQATQMLSIAVMLLIFVPTFGLQALPAAWQERLLHLIAGWNVPQAVLTAIAVLAVIDSVLIGAAMRRFQRTRLILE
ncbi:ABC transporter permease subunit [uncultured Chloroflexus sp.]|uniref:ABC transporter permease subunit n=1 Tax=uncultured Chloroflexus sp. TaxID=214040 RepID=UPI002625351A|nr:ABC transporter permease subunit [uncultured Chloroflexus sp.]